VSLPENPELYGMGAIVVALVTAWTKMRPAMRKIEADEDVSLRADLMNMVKELKDKEREAVKSGQDALLAQQRQHEANLKEVRAEYEAIIQRMEAKYDQTVAAYEARLADFQYRVDLLVDNLMAGPVAPQRDITRKD